MLSFPQRKVCPNEHANWLSEQLNSILELRCERLELRKRKEFITAETWQKLQEKKMVKKLLRESDHSPEEDEEAANFRKKILRHTIRGLNKVLRKMLKADKKGITKD